MPSSTQRLCSLPYFQDSATLFSVIASQPWAVFLDSGYPHCKQGRYDILAAEPRCTLVTQGDVTQITCDGVTQTSGADPFELVKQQLADYSHEAHGLPFNGGAIGYFAYDLARRLEKLPALAEDAEHIPEMAVGIYDWAVVVDHQQQTTHLIAQHCDETKWQMLLNQFSRPPVEPAPTDFKVLGPVTANMDKQAYGAAFNKIKRYLKEGDCYQVNLAQRFVAPCEGDPWVAYQALRKLNAAPFSCYLTTPDVQILSSSPERFLKLTNGVVETKPIKGTRPRGLNDAEDRQHSHDLQHSNKDRAENLMIVDLLRNDISKTCTSGSVKVPVLFDVESYATVHHLVSTVTGELAADKQALDLLKSCFPGGSITGAPKIRSMEIIEELEPHRRGVYCGAIGYIGFDGNMDTNIAIRTLVHSAGNIRFWAGGGIVNDSVMEEEYQECFDKAAAMLDLLKQLQSSDRR
ncbi:MAG: aminodeoxychorismate synthase component I [Methylococcaceae bacterium]|jgi:para-aminobenzoate synthetase component 1|nr:aminodeoxychorismate synthase component I [Methylococcaceae bacterium]MDZ4157805.1 aminodeoxychorismate synthase component I [Methylococcales bacterium]MDP2392310.1 aminodeoxychorismate synthase component I [Methylococcaceae bacterium]MDP3021204.1 aminodeoxychorismate synthase component I [Methylococcaceae bacterium]MDP3389755.1 aminodeoxychorismate synthase component I [Methylococcaceae bacterium]